MAKIPPVIRDNTPEEEAKIQQQIANDPDTWEMTGNIAKRGRPSGATKEQITVRLDKDLLAALRTPIPKGWQTRLNAAVRAGLKRVS
jgi:uncharacterized protein (DUF4415 family)